jgi:PHF5-like protein
MVVAVSYVERLVTSFISFLSELCIDNLLGISDAYYCAGCTRLEKDRDGCPKIVNLGASRTDLFYERRRLGTSDPSMFEIICNSFHFYY